MSRTVAAGRPDTRSMGVIHAALRRDLDRATIVLGGTPVPSGARVRAIAEHLVWLMDFLDHHHQAEDDRLYPFTRAKNAAAAALLEAMESDHAGIQEPMAEIIDASRSAQDDSIPLQDRTARLTAAVEGLRGPLYPHLEREELELMPVVEDSVTQADWDAYEHPLQDRPKSELAFIGHWAIDGLAEEIQPVITGVVPAPVRFVLLHFLGGPYKKRFRSMWEGTPAASVRSEPLFARGHP